jgi:spoIIIJ-associated protein
MSDSEDLKEAVNSFIISLEEEQRRIDSYKVEIDSKFEENISRKIKKEKETTTGQDKDNNGYLYVEKLLKNIIQLITSNDNIEVKKDKLNDGISIYGKDLSIAIGRNGRNLEAIEYIVNLIARKKKLTDKQINIDIKDYRKNTIEKLSKMAMNLAEKVIKEQKKILMKPMPSYERKIVHNALSKIKEVRTKSTNDEPNRRIIIYPTIIKN